MLRTVANVPVDASSPKKEEPTMDTSELLFNLDRSSLKEKRKKKSVDVSSSDDEEDDVKIENSENVLIDEDEARLENLVFGNEKNILDNMTKNNERKNKKNKTGLKFNQLLATEQASVEEKGKKGAIADGIEARKPAWDDDNDDEEKYEFNAD